MIFLLSISYYFTVSGGQVRQPRGAMQMYDRY
jgi:hypothetical protein